MASSGVNLFHLPSENPVTNEVKFSPSAGEGSEDEDYSASLSAVLRQRRTSVRRSRKGRARRPSSPFLADEARARRRSSVFTTSSGDTAISIEEGQPTNAVVTQEQIFENIHLHKEVLGSVKQQPLGMRRKLKIVHQAKTYIKRHEGQLQERLAQSKSTRDIYARFNILLATKWQQLKREAANTSNLLIPWELRIKEIESHFGSVVASYFTFLRWLFWVNLVIGFILLVFVIVPEYLTGNPQQDGERKIIMKDELQNATNLLTLWEFEGVLKFSPIFYGYYSNVERPQYRMPLAYFLTGLVVYIYSFVATLRKMAENSRMSKLSEKEDECIFSWKLFTGWDFMIGNAETAHNRIASVILGFKEALLEEAEKKKDLRNWRIISLRAMVNICVMLLLAVSAYAVVTVVSRSDDNPKHRSWWRENETTIVVTVISITFPVFFELLGFLEHYHPRKQLRLQLARIMLLNLLNLYSLIFALFSKIEGMSKDLDSLKPPLNMTATTLLNNTLNVSETLALNVPMFCFEERVTCEPCYILPTIAINVPTTSKTSSLIVETTTPYPYSQAISNRDQLIKKDFKKSFPQNVIPKYLAKNQDVNNDLGMNKQSNNVNLKKINKDFIISNVKGNNLAENLIDSDISTTQIESTTLNSIDILKSELERVRNISQNTGLDEDDSIEEYDEDYINSTDYPFNVSKSIHPTTNIDTSHLSKTITETITVSTENTETGSSERTQEYSTEPDSTLSNNNENNNQSSTDMLSVSTEEDMNISSSTETLFSYYGEETNRSTKDTTKSIDYHTTPDIFSTNTYETTEETLTTFVETNTPYLDQDRTFITFPNEETTTYNNSTDSILTETTYSFNDNTTIESTEITSFNPDMKCPTFFNCSSNCGGRNITQVFFLSNCRIVEKRCYVTKCELTKVIESNKTNETVTDIAYIDDHNRKMYILTTATKKKLLKLCWETMFGQELVKLTMMDLVFVLLGTLFMDFFRALFVRYMNRCWCWDLEKKFPEYGDFKIAENILHLINNQGMVWMGMFFSPGLVVLNVVKLMIMMYLRSWAVMTCNVPHEVVFRVSKSNNFYLALLLTMLFLCVLPVGYTIVWVKPSWHCGPFSEYEKIYHILTNNIYKILPKSLNFALEYAASPAIVIPLLVLLILIIYYLTSLTNSLREANNDLKIQLRRERTEERRKMFQLADTRRRGGSSAMDNTPFARWKKALPSLPISKSIDSDERKTTTGDDNAEPSKSTKRKGGIFAKIVGMALDKKPEVETVPEVTNISQSSNNFDDETDTDFHETLPKEVLKIKDIIFKSTENKKRNNVEFKTPGDENHKINEGKGVKLKLDKIINYPEKKIKDENQDNEKEDLDTPTEKNTKSHTKFERNQTSESSTQSKQTDSISSVIPVIKISITESDEEDKNSKTSKVSSEESSKQYKEEAKSTDSSVSSLKKVKKSCSDLKALRRQSSVDSMSEHKVSKDKKSEDGHKYQYSL
ncbi:unnamed protein product [Chilo suppressalis]|uniref:TMC domain-containing protein n=1 Tax=Chilo suppressalis TaxID=168631 RepID=A0ABN8B788_CHISP|nr:unnamed protein product [Chilo suppressalis]